MKIILFIIVLLLSFVYCYQQKKDTDFYKKQFKKLITTNDTFLVVKYYLDENGKMRAKEEKHQILPETTYQLWLKDGIDLKGIYILRNVKGDAL